MPRVTPRTKWLAPEISFFARNELPPPPPIEAASSEFLDLPHEIQLQIWESVIPDHVQSGLAPPFAGMFNEKYKAQKADALKNVDFMHASAGKRYSELSMPDAKNPNFVYQPVDAPLVDAPAGTARVEQTVDSEEMRYT